jgi:cleavage and polyadenylation specificity factor subunit 3
MLRLKSKLLSLNAPKPIHLKTKVFSPANCEELRIPIRMDKTAKVVGKLADRIRMPRGPAATTGVNNDDDDEEYDPEDQIISGVLVQNDLKLSLMDPEDLREYAGLTTTTIMCRQKVTLAAAGIELIRWALEGTFGGIVDLTPNAATNGTSTNGNGHVKKEQEDGEEEADGDADRVVYKFLVMDTVTVIYRNQGEIEVEWEGNMINDGIADAVMSVLLTVESSPAAVKREFAFSFPSLLLESPRLQSPSHLTPHTSPRQSYPSL